MAGEVDNRIVQLQFENRQFEKNIAKSKKSLEELKEAMDFDETSKGLEKISRGMGALDFGKMENNLQRLTDKFTGLGNAGEYVLSRIRAGVESAARSVESLVRSLSLDQINVGQSKYDALNKAVQTIIAGGKYSEKEAYGVMERAMEYTNQTSHSFQTMVGQISALQSIDMGLTEAEHLLEGIGNAATMAGAGASEAASSMALISKVMGGTHLGRMQFDSLNQTYRVITSKWRQLAVEAGVEVGNLVKKGDKIFTASKFGSQVQVTPEQLENTLAKKWLNSEVLKNIYSRYFFGETINDLQHPEDAMDSFGKTAYLTGQRALTFADALNAIKESVSAGWMQTFRIVLGDVSEAMAFFTDLCDRVIESLENIKNFRIGVLESWRAKGGRNALLDILLGDYWEGAEEGAVGFMDMLDRIGDIIGTGLTNLFALFASPDDSILMKKDPAYLQAWLGIMLRDMTVNIEKFMQRVHGFFDTEIEVNGESKSRLQVIHEIVQGVAGALKFAYDILSSAIGFFLTVGEQLQPSFDAVIGFFGDLSTAIYGSAEAQRDEGTIKQFFLDLVDIIKPVTDGINSVVVSVTDFLRVLLGLDSESDNAGKAMSSLGEFLKIIGDTIAKIAGPVLTFISSVIDLITELIRGGISKDKFRTFGEGLGTAFSTMLSAFVDALPEQLGFLGNWIRDLFGLWDDEAHEDTNSFFSFLHKLFTGGFKTFDDLLGGLTEGLSLKRFLETGFGFGEAFNFLNTMIGYFKNTNLYGILMAFLGVATLGTLWRLIANIKKTVRSIGGFFDDVGGSIKAGVLSEYEWFSEKFINIAKAIALLVAAVAILGGMDPGALIRGTIVLGLIMGGFALFVLAMNQFKGRFMDTTSITVMIGTLAASIAVLAVAIAVLSLALLPLSSDPKKMLTAVLGFAAIITIIGFFIKIMLDKMREFALTAGSGKVWAGIGQMAVYLLMLAGFIAALSVSISTLVLALTPLALTGGGKILSVVLGFTAILAVIGTFMMIMLKRMSEFATSIGNGSVWSGIGQMAVMLIMLAGFVTILSSGLSVLMVALTPLSATGWQGILSASVGFGLILTAIGTFMMVMLRQMNDFTTSVGGGGQGQWAGIGKMALMLITLSATIALLAIGIGAIIMAITPLAVMGLEGVAKAVIGLGVILFELGVFIKAVTKMNTKDKTASVKIAGLAGFAFSLGILVLALTPLALMTWDAWARAILGLGLVLAMLIGTIKLVQKMSAKDQSASLKIAGMAGFAASIGILMLSLRPLADMDWGGWARAMAGLAIVLLELVGFMFLIKKMKLGENALQLAGLTTFSIGLYVLMNSLKPLAEMTPEGYLQAMVGLGTVLLEIIVLMEIMKEVQPDLKQAGATMLLLIGLGAAMILFGVAFNEVKDVPWQTILAMAAGISAILIALGVASKFAKSGNIKGMLLVVLGLAAVLGVLALMAPLVIDSIGTALTKLSGHLVLISNMMQSFSGNMNGVDEGAIDKGERIIDKLKSLFGKMLGFAFEFGDVSQFTRAMAQMNLAAGQLQMFSNKLALIPEGGNVNKMSSAAEGIQKIFEGPLSGVGGYSETAKLFSGVMYELSTALGTFNYNTKDLDAPENSNGLKTIQALSNSASGLDTIAKLNLDNLTAQMAGLGGAMRLYAQGAEEVGSLEIGETPDVDAAVRLMQAISTSLADENGTFVIPKDMPDATETGLFGASLAAIAGALIQFEEAGSGLGEGTEKALEVLDFFRDLKSRLETTNFTDNLTSVSVFGEGDEAKGKADELATFGKNISQLAQSMGQFVNNTTYLDEETGEVKSFDYANAVKAMEDIAGIATKLPSFDGAIEIFTGKRESLGTFATEINLLGGALNDFHKNTTAMDTANANPPEFDYTNAIGALNELAALPGKLPPMEGFVTGLFVKTPDLTKFAGDIILLGGALNEFSSKVGGKDEKGNPIYDADAMGAAIGTVDQMIPVINKLKESLPNLGGLSNIWSSIWTGRSVQLSDIATQIKSLGEGLGELGRGIGASGWSDDDAIKNAFDTIDTILGLMIHLEEYGTQITGSGYVNLDKLTYFIEGLTQMNQYDDGITHNSIADSLVDFMDKLSVAFIMLEDENGNLNIVKERIEMFRDFAQGLNYLTNSDMEKSWSYIGSKLTTDTAAGISSGISSVVDAMTAVFTAAEETARTGTATILATVSQVMAESADAHPEITPVLNLTTVEEQLRGLNSGFVRTRVGIDTSASALNFGGFNGGLFTREEPKATDLSGVYTRMDSLSERITELGTKIESMQIVLDTGALVGGISDGIDDDLGMKEFYAGRGNT